MKNIVISNTTDTPIYQQLSDQIKTQILNGDLNPNSSLPSIRTMAKELRVSIITIKKAWETLEKDGYIDTVAGKGSYVAGNTKKALKEKRENIVRNLVQDQVKVCKELEVSKQELIELINKLY